MAYPGYNLTYLRFCLDADVEGGGFSKGGINFFCNPNWRLEGKFLGKRKKSIKRGRSDKKRII